MYVHTNTESVTRSHKVNNRRGSGSSPDSHSQAQAQAHAHANGQKSPSEHDHLPHYFAKKGPVFGDPTKIKKNGGGKGNWYDPLYYLYHPIVSHSILFPSQYIHIPPKVYKVNTNEINPGAEQATPPKSKTQATTSSPAANTTTRIPLLRA